MSKEKFAPEYVRIKDLYLAYRKAKHEAFYDSLHPNAIEFTEYEKNLKNNLEYLLSKLNAKNQDWCHDIDFIGGYLYAPKSLDDSKWSGNGNVHYRAVDPKIDWIQRFKENDSKKLRASYRLLINPSINFQIISALWILKVGHKFEEKLDRRLSYGHRLRRISKRQNLFSSRENKLNEDSLGLFSPYFSDYKSWRENGLKSMRSAVEAEKSITAITMDLTGFYHNSSPKFLLKPSFLKKLGLEISKDEKLLTKLLLSSIDTWYQTTPDFSDREAGALPVGLSASKIISNVLLHQFDEEAKSGLVPLYYGRYVDDIFIVIETPANVESGLDVLRWLSNSIPCLKIKYIKNQSPELKLSFNYAQDSDLFFSPSKQKIFSLSSTHGMDLVDQISAQIREHSSEYRLLPELPEAASEMAVKALLATPDASLAADALRKADVVSVRRLGFSLLVRDVEAYSTNLSRSEWSSLRREFYGLIQRHVLTPKGVFELFSYYPRIFKIMVANYDFEDAKLFLENIFDCFSLIESTTVHSKGDKKRLFACKSYFEKAILQSALQASTTKKFSEWTKLGRLLRKLFSLHGEFTRPNKKPSLLKISNDILLADWGSRPYKDYWYYSQDIDYSHKNVPRSLAVRRVIRLGAIKKFRQSAELKVPHWPALAFPTRPLSIQEIALISPSVLSEPLLYKSAIKGLRGAGVVGLPELDSSNNEDGPCLTVSEKNKDKIVVALTNVETKMSHWEGAAQNKPDLSLSRYKTICVLVNEILRSQIKPDYIVFPECSVPRRWAIGIASKLAKQGISLLCGIEYYEHKKQKNYLRNDCLVSLTSNWPGYPSNLIYMQPKLQPSHNEKQSLARYNKKQFLPSGGVNSLPIYNHGGYIFGVLICSDLTNPANRARYQGKVDSLYVLEWNKDVKTFGFLVEGTAHDVHTHVVQVNNRAFGDSRIRAPYREEFRRDSVRLKGGVSDYFVMGEIDYRALRKFQRTNKMTANDKKFKPVPIGFKMSRKRKQGK
ncbi:RNA-directed DNA polymerase [Microbulbifer sp. TRSA002]|uniref:RNA-directed DNA polymerase n=1 Tax=Microbulbifer sp. TRSA002 TaxID=3243382 RepID=UPI004039C12B